MEKINMTVGRFQPFTKGHLNMVVEGEAPCIVYQIKPAGLPEKLKGLKAGSRTVKKDDINIVLVYNTGAELAFYYLTECTDERVTFTYNGSTKDDYSTKTFTITKNSYSGPICDTMKYVNYNQGANNANKFLVVTPYGTVWPSSDLVLPSSTSGSSKKFKITVDDSGAISATEV